MVRAAKPGLETRLERVADTLALQVVDQDMDDEIRSVHSLSVGESFLVSLALALGLASLSSNRVKVDSLFIDEGFDSLDADTLRVAMNALDNLQSKGRKIGIIDQSPLALVIRDGFPISPGHTLVIPRRHVGSFFESAPAC